MTWTYNPEDSIGQIRLMIPDRIEAEMIFSDEELTAFLALEASRPKRAAAQALETIASDQALVLKVLKAGAVTTDGAKLSDALLARAKTLRSQDATEVTEDDTEVDGAFDVAEMAFSPFGIGEILTNRVLRNG